MEDEYVSRDILVQRIEALCCLAETHEATTGTAARRRLITAMDVVIDSIRGTKIGKLVDVTGKPAR